MVWNPEIMNVLVLEILFLKCYCAPSIGSDVSDHQFKKIILKFCPNFVLIRLIVILILSLYAKYDSWLHKINKLLVFAVILQVFWHTSENWIVKFLLIIFKTAANSCKGTAKTKHNVVIIKISVIPANIESYRPERTKLFSSLCIGS